MLRLPLESSVAADLVRLFRAELELCRVQRGEQVLIFCEPESNPHYAAAFFGAAGDLGADAFIVTGSALGAGAGGSAATGRAEPRGSILDLMKQVGMIIDITIRGLLHSDLQLEILRAGTRILRIREPVEVLRRLFPQRDVVDRVKASARVLDGGSRYHLTSLAGTDLTIERGGRVTTYQYGYADEPGRFDQWGTALVANPPLESRAQGRLVLDAGDLMFPFGRYVREPVALEVENGRIVRVTGGLEARLFEDDLRRAGDPDARAISHVGWGCDPRADWNILNRVAAQGVAGVETRSYYGALLIAFGANADLGGANRTRAHYDLALRGVSYEVDGTTVLDAGRFALPELA
jgi:2,5-dihydroxypyridine 5,6-dioxygenase